MTTEGGIVLTASDANHMTIEAFLSQVTAHFEDVSQAALFLETGSGAEQEILIRHFDDEPPCNPEALNVRGSGDRIWLSCQYQSGAGHSCDVSVQALTEVVAKKFPGVPVAHLKMIAYPEVNEILIQRR